MIAVHLGTFNHQSEDVVTSLRSCKMQVARSPRLQPRSVSKGASRTGGTSDMELLSAMTGRLSKAENALRIANSEIERQHKVICDHEREISTLKLQQKDTVDNSDLESRYTRLLAKTHQMEVSSSCGLNFF